MLCKNSEAVWLSSVLQSNGILNLQTHTGWNYIQTTQGVGLTKQKKQKTWAGPEENRRDTGQRIVHLTGDMEKKGEELSVKKTKTKKKQQGVAKLGIR